MNKRLIGILSAIIVIASLVFTSLSGYLFPPEEIPAGGEVVAANLEIPWSLAFAQDGRLFFTERVGRVSTIKDGQLRVMLSLNVAASQGDEGGLLGLALDPDFSHNHLVYLYYTYRDGGRLWNRVSRFTENGTHLHNEMIVLDLIPGHRIHNGGRIRFGPDGKLYITTGDAGQPQLAQDLQSLAGKILRANADGSVPADNPFPRSLVYSFGHRNPQGLTWHPLTKDLYATEHGPSGHDEINLIKAGANYGWPIVVGRGNNQEFTDPIYETGQSTWAPSGVTFYKAPSVSRWNLSLFVATLRGKHIRVVILDPMQPGLVNSTNVLFSDYFGRIRDVAQGPDGYLYLATSNRDGRGNARVEDDRILRNTIVPE